MKRCVFLFFITVVLLSVGLQNITAQSSTLTDSLEYSLYANKVISAQSAACYGDYLVFVSRQVSRITLYNLHTKKTLYSLQLTPKTEMRGNTDIYHANNSFFGKKKYHKSDPFSLLYVSHRENNELRGVLDVYRVIPYHHRNGDDYDSLSVEQVQTVYYPEMTDENALGSPWTAIDTQRGYMYTYSRNNRKGADNQSICRISKFKIPKLTHYAISVFLEDKDILESYEVDFNASLSQGACIFRNMMYIVQGVPQRTGKTYLRVIDLKRKKLVKTYHLHTIGFTEEPEGCFIYNNKLMITTINRNIYQINNVIEQ